MKVLVTGGAGYIGSHAIKVLLQKGYEVVVIDNLSTGHIEAVDSNAKLYIGDIGDDLLMDKIFAENKISGVIHFAAYSLVGESMKDPFKYYENNISKTNHLLHSMVRNNVMNIVFSSTAATYGEAKRIPILEDNPQNPTNVYGQTKLAMEQMINWYGKIHNLKSVALRYFNVSGAYEDGSIGEAHDPETHLIPNILKVANSQKSSVDLYGNDYNTKDGSCVRDFIHVLDLCDAHVLALEYLLNGNESDAFNLGSGEGYSVFEIVEASRRITNHPINAKICPRRQGDPSILIASSEKAKKVLGWNPIREDVNKIIQDSWTWEQNRKY